VCHGFVAFLWQIPPIGPVLPVFPTNNCFTVNKLRVDWHLHTVEVVGSNPAVPTNVFNNLTQVRDLPSKGIVISPELGYLDLLSKRRTDLLPFLLGPHYESSSES
jgi:hypothetical protein